MARKVTKEEIANGTYIDGSQLEKISDDVVESYNNIDLGSVDKKYQVTQITLTSGYARADNSTGLLSGQVLWLPAQNVPDNVSPVPYPRGTTAGNPFDNLIKNKFRTKGYIDYEDQTADPLDASSFDEYVLWQSGIAFDKPVIIIGWDLFIQGVDSYYTWEGEDGAGQQVQHGMKCIIQGKNIFEQRDRRFDEILMNNVVNFKQSQFFGGLRTAPAGPRDRFPVPPDAISGYMVENKVNIPVVEQGQVIFTCSVPFGSGLSPWVDPALGFMASTKVSSVITILEECE